MSSYLPDAKLEVTLKEYDEIGRRALIEVYIPPEFDQWVGTHITNFRHSEWVPIGKALTFTLQGGRDERGIARG